MLILTGIMLRVLQVVSAHGGSVTWSISGTLVLYRLPSDLAITVLVMSPCRRLFIRVTFILRVSLHSLIRTCIENLLANRILQ
ncbi:hypothetical protein BKA67DRAFT_577575 [Truncatella angustata]|uniref:Secreted protein n=1 Tax=Truncatella angustata TaxID=152316 RepID=A0A9P8RNJ7_9PEZI|nr:uncharacterized protein BKA67DRAFT_577575 [Truncatella angustata]KAH6647475.1 hypothetical protein BKA67DRAFT_577575 [Truncatella angustata]